MPYHKEVKSHSEENLFLLTCENFNHCSKFTFQKWNYWNQRINTVQSLEYNYVERQLFLTFNHQYLLFCNEKIYISYFLSSTVVTLKTGRRELQSLNPGRACRPGRSEFFVVFPETRVNTG